MAVAQTRMILWMLALSLITVSVRGQSCVRPVSSVELPEGWVEDERLPSELADLGVRGWVSDKGGFLIIVPRIRSVEPEAEVHPDVLGLFADPEVSRADFNFEVPGLYRGQTQSKDGLLTYFFSIGGDNCADEFRLGFDSDQFKWSSEDISSANLEMKSIIESIQLIEGN